MASDDSSGKPITQPPATASNAGQAARGGNGARRMPSHSAASSAAPTARAIAAKVGSSSATARRVNGNVRLKIATPVRPSSMPTVSSAGARRDCVRMVWVGMVVVAKWLD